jgi:hypothetical protein
MCWKERDKVIIVFFSYAHEDEQYRNGLEVHLASLKREGIIDAWHDRRITAGKNLNDEISEHLEHADIVLLLVSPYFLDSDYCWQVEMNRALERHRAGQARVIPVIVRPCDWQNTPIGKLRASPPDGKPITKFPDIHDGYLAVVKDIREAIGELFGRGDRTRSAKASTTPAKAAGRVVPGVRSGNLRIKKEFTDRERDEFLDESFEFMANFFENSVQELQGRNPGIETRFKRIDKTRFTAAVYERGRRKTSCRIWLSDDASLPGIRYSESEMGGWGSFNESLSVKDDGYNLLLEPLGMSFGVKPEHDLSQEGAAEFLWGRFIHPLQ